MGNKSFRNILFAVIMVLGVALSIIVSALSYYSEKKLIQAELNEAAEDRYSALKRELDSDIAVLASLQALYYTSEKDIQRSEFRNFTSHILKRHASIKALNWIPRVPDSRREAYERAARREGFPDFKFTERIAQGKMKRIEKRKEYFPVYFVEPYKGNEIALGFDVASNPTRLETLEVAGMTGEIRATARVILVPETRSQFGFLVFAPIYKKGVTMNSDRSRWDNLEGFVLGTFRISDIAEKAINYLKPAGVDFFIYDASAPEKERFLYTHSARTRKTPLLDQKQPETDVTNSKTLEVAGRKWMVIYSATPDFIAARSSWRPWGLLLAGLVVTGLVAGFLVIVSHAENVEKSAKDLSHLNTNLAHEIRERKQVEEALIKKQKELHEITSSLAEGIYVMNQQGAILFMNPEAERLFGWTMSELLEQNVHEMVHYRKADGSPLPFKECGMREVMENGIRFVSSDEVFVRKDGTVFPISVICSPVIEDGKTVASVTAFRDITEQKNIENDRESLILKLGIANRELEQEVSERTRVENVLKAKLLLSQHADMHPLADMLQETLDEAERITQSQIGFFHFVEPDQITLSLQNWSTSTLRQCSASGKGQHDPISEAGAWADCIRERRAIIHNDYASLPHKHWMPEGHVPLKRELCIPIFQGEKIVAVIGVGNKLTDYLPEDVGYITQLASLAWDIVQRKRAEEALRQSEERFRLAMLGATDGLWDRNLLTDEIYYSPRWKTMLGYADEELANHLDTWKGLLHPDDREPALALVRDFLEGRADKYEAEFRLRHKDGHYLDILSRGSLIRGINGEALRFVGTHVDITERKQTEEQIIALNEQLKQQVAKLDAANKELEAFSYSVSHDLRAPLRHMSGFMKLLQKRLGDYPDVETRDYMASIVEASKKMDILIDDLLAFSRIARVEMRKKKVSLKTLVKAAIGDIRSETKARDIIWDIDELPDVYGDQSMLSLVLANLISNAVKYTSTRSRAEIKIGYKEDKEEFIFSVKDNGVGFDMKYADKLFCVFQRLHTQNEFEGNGIGLSIVQRIIARHDGRVWAESAVGQGAAFYFALPKVKET